MRPIRQTTTMSSYRLAQWAHDQLGAKLSSTDFGNGKTYETQKALFDDMNENPEVRETVIDFFVKRQERIYKKFGKIGTIRATIVNVLRRDSKHCMDRESIIMEVKKSLPVFPDEVEFNNGIDSGLGSYDTIIGRELYHLMDKPYSCIVFGKPNYDGNTTFRLVKCNEELFNLFKRKR